MVMKRNAMRKNLRQSILKSLGRYIAIVAIIALGSGLFMGLLMTKTDMVATGQKYMDEQNMFDLRLMNSYGWTEEYLEQIKQLEGIVDAEGVSYLDLIARLGDSEEDSVYRFYTIPATVDLVALRGGRMPERPDECLADGFHFDDSVLGKTVTLSTDNDPDSLDCVVEKTFTIVGYVASPLYMDMNRGTTTVGSGSLSSFFYVPKEALDLDYYMEIHVTIPGDWYVYTEEYEQALEDSADALEPALQALADRRLEEVRAEAEEAYQEGLQEYSDGLTEYVEGKAEAEQELADAYQKLKDAEQEIADNEQRLTDGEQQIQQARETLKKSEKTLQKSKQTLANAKAAAYKQLSNSTMSLMAEFQDLSGELTELKSDIQEVSTQTIALTSSILPLETEMKVLDAQISQTKTVISILDTSISAVEKSLETAGPEDAEELQQELDELRQSRSDYQTQLAEQEARRSQINAELEPLYAQQAELEQKQAALEASASQIQSALDSITESLMELVVTQAVMENEFAAAEAQIESGEAQIEEAYLELDEQERNIADGWTALEEGRQELADGWKEYEEGKAEAEQKLANGLQELKDAGQELEDARKTIAGMTKNDIILLDRGSNIGYNSLDSTSDIVQGVSRVFPVFFLLVASLVCITTMTRMIDEERTQIGTLKALGYSNAAIIGKYMVYSGSGAVIGCGLGVIVGSVIFPAILWQAYCIMLYIQPGIVLTMNWPLCFIVVAVYTAVLLLVTWYCCRKALREEPAELIRPKAPEAGKKILVEYLPFWNRISFLNKVTIRNIFRYRQRMAMMLVGIGGCTALLVTGFGLRDSIVNVVDYQFEEVTHYDLQVYFREGVTSEFKKEFQRDLGDGADNTMFYNQSSIDIAFDNRAKEIYMICAGDELTDFIDLHYGDETVEMPGINETVLSAGVAEAMGIDVGDTVQMRNSDMQTLELTVSGIYENHVYNYGIVRPETIEAQWDEPPEEQMAFIQTAEGQDVYALSAAITEMDEVMNVSVSVELADTVGGMMEAMDMVVLLIVFCAGLLAVIVLYNLTNININERIREIATIKVLGFNASETSAYVFKENMALTVFGSLIGLFLGYLLLLFVMSQIKIDMVWFKVLVEPRSYLLSAVLTLLSAVIVDFIFYFKLEKINMAEALKSVE